MQMYAAVPFLNSSEESVDDHRITVDTKYEPPLYDQYEPPYPDFTQLPVVHFCFVFTYVLVIVLSIVGNSLVCLTVFRNKKMHTAINYYIVNLGLCDLLVGSFVMPVKLLELAAPAQWQILNDALCTVTMYLQTVFVFCSVLTLVATCVERYFAIVHPLESRMHHSKSRAKCILLFIWVTPCLVAAPFLYPAEAYANNLHSDYGTMARLTCFDSFSEEFRRSYFIFLFLFIYLLPLCFISGTCVCIIRVLMRGIPFHRQGSLRRQETNRRKVAKMIIVVIVAYAVSWTPYFMVTIVTQFQTDSFLHKGQFFFTMLSINLFAFANSCINPFIYAAMSARFRHGFRSIFLLLLCCNMCMRNVGDDTSDTRNIRSLEGEGGTGGRRLRCGHSTTSCLRPQSSSDTPTSSQDVSGGTINKFNNNQVMNLIRMDSSCSSPRMSGNSSIQMRMFQRLSSRHKSNNKMICFNWIFRMRNENCCRFNNTTTENHVVL